MGREIKQAAGKTEHPTVVRVPDVVGVVVVAVEPETILVMLDVEDLEVAVRVGNV
jgi:hypothetical protein